MASQNPQGQKDDKPKLSIPSADSVLDYFKSHMRETASYILLIVGILLLFFDPLYGGLIIGVVSGIYFGDDIVCYIKRWRKEACASCNNQQIAHHVICLGLALAFFIAAPAIYIGAAIAIAIQQLFASPTVPK
ncbi:MAG: hypothetical protein WCF65_02140 [Parachlamydiaceae bacterium]